MKRFQALLVYLSFSFLAWFAVAEIVFTFRHSWMTDTERLIYVKSAMLFRKVSINEVRP